jgi:hypothetical protein
LGSTSAEAKAKADAEQKAKVEAEAKAKADAEQRAYEQARIRQFWAAWGVAYGGASTTPKGTIAEEDASASGASTFKLDSQDRMDIRNGRLPSAIRAEARMASIDQDVLLTYLNNLQSQIRQYPATQSAVSVLLHNDGEMFWSVVGEKLLDSLTYIQNTPRENRAFPNESIYDTFRRGLKGTLFNSFGVRVSDY